MEERDKDKGRNRVTIEEICVLNVLIKATGANLCT